MKHWAGLLGSMMAKRVLSMVLCLAITVTSGGICVATTANLLRETRAAGLESVEPAGRAARVVERSNSEVEEADSGEEDTQTSEEEEAAVSLHEFTQLWTGYECSLTDYISDYEPGDEVRIKVTFDRKVVSYLGVNIDGAWNSFQGEGKERNITLIPDNDYLNIQIGDLNGYSSVNLTGISAEIIRKGEADNGCYLHKFTGLWQGFETKFSDYDPDYAPGDEVKVTVVYNKYVSSQMGVNIDGKWDPQSGDGKEISKVMRPDNDYLNIQITDMWTFYQVGIVSISVEITKKGEGLSGHGEGGRLSPTKYTEPGDYLLFCGEANEKYETNDGWILDCADTDYLTLTYDCTEAEHENWGIMGWGLSIDGEWKDGPQYSVDNTDSTKEVTQTFSVKYLRRMMKITPESNVGYICLGTWSEGRIKNLTLHVGSKILRNRSLFSNGAPNQSWVCSDIEQILDEDEAKYICVEYRCATSDYGGWTVLGWGASVDGEWKDGASYKVSVNEATRNHFASMRLDAFKRMFGLRWDARIDSIKLSAYNDGQILDIWISDTKVTDPGNYPKEKIVKEASYSSPNHSTYHKIVEKEGMDFAQDKELNEPWEQFQPDGEREMIESLKKGVYLVVEYESETKNPPTLYIAMKDNKQKHVQPSWYSNGYAVYSYETIVNAFSGCLIPQEIDSIAISTGEKPMTIKTVRIVEDDSDLKEEAIAVLTSDWSGYATEFSKYHSGYKKGDQVTVTVTFDKSAEGCIAFNINGKWDAGPMMSGTAITRTVVPDDDYMNIQIGKIPENKKYVMIKSIKVDIAGKTNYDNAVEQQGDRSALLAFDSKEAVKAAGLTDGQVNAGVKLIIHTEKSQLTDEEKADEEKILNGDSKLETVLFTSSCVDISLKLADQDESTFLSEIPGELQMKIGAPSGIDTEKNDFAIVRLHNGEIAILPDLDDNPDTITFASDKFSKYGVIYGQTGSFDYLTGDTSLYTFREAWARYETHLQTYNSEYEADDEVRVTVKFNKETSSQLAMNTGGAWTAVASGDGDSISAVVTPDNDYLNIQITDMHGEKSVKIIEIKVEITKKGDDGTEIHKFTGAWEGFETSFSTYDQAYIPGIETKVTLTFDKPVKSKFGYNSPGWTDANGTEVSETFVKTVTPMDDYLNIQIMDMNGNGSVKLLDVKVEQKEDPVTALHEFTQEWSGYDTAFSTYNENYDSGKETTVTLIFDKAVSVKYCYHNKEGDADAYSDGLKKKIVLTVTPDDDYMSIQLSNMNGNGLVKLLEVKADQEQEPVTSIYEFTAPWAGYETEFGIFNDSFEAGRETTVTLAFDKEVDAQAACHTADSDWYVQGGSGREISLQLTPSDSYLNIQITDMKDNKSVKLLSVEVEQENVLILPGMEEDPVYVFTEPGVHTLDLTDYGEDIEIGKKVNLVLDMVSDQPFKVMVKEHFEEETEGETYNSDEDNRLTIDWTAALESSEIDVIISDMGEKSQGVAIICAAVMIMDDEPVKNEINVPDLQKSVTVPETETPEKDPEESLAESPEETAETEANPTESPEETAETEGSPTESSEETAETEASPTESPEETTETEGSPTESLEETAETEVSPTENPTETTESNPTESTEENLMEDQSESGMDTDVPEASGPAGSR